MRRVLFVHPFKKGGVGGAERCVLHHIDEKPRGVKVKVVSPWKDCDLAPYDAVVVGNLRPPGGPGFEAEVAGVLRWANKLARYDGFSLRVEYDVQPCTYRDGRCIDGRKLKQVRCKCSTAMRDANELLYNSASAVQFLSPSHQRVINQLITVRVPQHIIATPIDLSMFRSVTPREQRPPKALITGDAIRVAKTSAERARRAGYEPDFVEYLSVPFKKMPELYNQYQAVVVDPVMFHAFGRVAVEAMACGCEVLASERVGAMSFEDPLHACRVANDQFWGVLAEGCQRAAQPTKVAA